jgi:hypothetical protein
MSEPSWQPLAQPIDIPANSEHLWTSTDIFVDGPILLRLVAKGKWSYSAKFAVECSADGDWKSAIPVKRCVSSKAPVGSLIGKIGGSIADPGGEAVFLVGCYCVLEVGQDKRGPLYLTINDLLDGPSDNEGKLQVTIDFAPAAKSS